MADIDRTVSDEVLASIKRLRDQKAQGATPEGQQADQEELGGLDYYQVAANAHEGRDPSLMGPVQQLLVSGDSRALRARLGPQKAAEVENAYYDAWKKVAVDRQASRSSVDAVTDAAVGIPASLGNSLWGGQMLAAGLVSPDAMAESAQAYQDFNQQHVDPLYSEGLRGHRRIAGALDAGAAQEHAAQAAQEIAAGGGSTWAGTKRVAKDIGSSALSTITDPTLLMQGTAEAAASMLEAAYIEKGLMKVGGMAIGSAATRVIAEDMAAGAARTMAQAVQSEGVKALEKRLTNLSVMGATGITEGMSAYQQSAADVLRRSPEELTRTSAPYREKVQELVQSGVKPEEAQRQAKNWLAHQTALVAAAGTAASSAAIGHFLPEAVEDPFHVVSKAETQIAAGAKDVGKETVEEFSQTFAGQLIANKATQAYVDPKQDMLENLGQAGQAGVLGGFSAGVTKGPDALFGTARLGAAGAGLLSGMMADKKIAKLTAEGVKSTGNLTAEAESLYNDTGKIAKLKSVVEELFKQYPVATKDALGTLNELTKTPMVFDLPGTLKHLPAEAQKEFAPGMNRVAAIDKAATLFNAATDPKQKEALAVFLNELMEPVRKYENLPKNLEIVNSHGEGKQILSSFQQFLANINALPQVKKAQTGIEEMLTNTTNEYENTPTQAETPSKAPVTEAPVSEVTPSTPTVNDVEVQRAGMHAIIDPTLGGHVSSKKVEGYLAHADGPSGNGILTETQRRALAVSLGLIRAQEKGEELRTGGNKEVISKVMQNHIKGERTRESVGRQAVHQTDPKFNENGKYSVKRHMTDVANAITSGDLAGAKKKAERLRNFAQSHNNKKTALNDSYENGGTNEEYLQTDPTTGDFRKSSSNPKSEFPHAFVESESPTSIEHARTVDAEGTIATTAYNELLKAFPDELSGMAPVENVDLHPDLRAGTTEEAQKLAAKKSAKVKAKVAADKAPKVPDSIQERDRAIAEADAQTTTAKPTVEKPKPAVVEKPTAKPVESPPVVAPAAPVPMAPVTTKEEIKPVSRVTPEQAQKLSDSELTGQVNDLLEKGRENWTSEDDLTFKVLNADEDRRGELLPPAPVKQPEDGSIPVAPKEDESTPAPATTETPAVKPPKAKKTSVAELFPNLIKTVVRAGEAGVNYLHRSFTVREGASRFQDKTSPAAVAHNALSSRADLEAFLGKEAPLYLKETATAFQKLLQRSKTSTQNMGGIVDVMQRNLETASFYDAKADGTGGVTMLEAMQDGRAHSLMDASRGKVLNTVAQNKETGKFQYDPKLLQLAVMAGLQWQITASQREVPVKDDQVIKSLKIDKKKYPGLVGSFDEDVLRRIGTGTVLADAKSSLAGLIQQFWGLQSKKDQPLGYTDGIPEAMANEVLRAMADPSIGLVEVEKTELADEMRKLVNSKGKPLYHSLADINKVQDRAVRATMVPLIDQTIYRYRAIDWSEDGVKGNSPLYAWPSLLSDLVLTEPEPISFFSNSKKPVPLLKGQLGNSKVVNSERSDNARRNMQETEFRIHRHIADLVNTLFDDALLDLFGTKLLDDSKYNKVDLKSKQAKNKALLAGRDQLRKDYTEMLAIAGNEEGALAALGKKYQYAVGANGRMMIQGANNPQANKLMREMMMATWSKLDLSGKGSPEAHHQYFMLAMAQALGQKIHRKSFLNNVAWAEGALAGTLKNAAGETVSDFSPAIEVISNYLDDVNDAKAIAKEQSKEAGTKVRENLPQFPVKGFKEALKASGVASSPLVLMALMEAARVQQASPEELKSFHTPLYLEADGMTNGPFNAMGLLTVGGFLESWVRNVKRGGASFKIKNADGSLVTSDQLLKESDGADLYKASMDAAGGYISKVLTTIRSQAQLKGYEGDAAKQIKSTVNSLYRSLNNLFGDDIKWAGDEDTGTPELDRGAGKGPVTQMVYASGSPGVASGIASELMKKFYAQLSLVAANPELAQTEEHQALLKYLAEIASTQVYASGDGDTKTYKIDSKNPGSAQEILARMKNAQKFKFNPEEIARMEGNLTHLLVNPMRQGIQETMGHSVKASGDLIVKSTGLMANFSRVLYVQQIEKLVNEKIAALTAVEMKAKGLVERDGHAERLVELRERNKKDSKKPLTDTQKAELGKLQEIEKTKRLAHNRIQSEFLSENELNEIWDKTAGAMPFVKADDQSFLVVKKSLLEFWNNKSERNADKHLYSMALDHSMRTSPQVEAVGNPGVSGVPLFTIGMGDARMVREIFQDPAFTNAFQVYDGVNLPVDKISTYGEQVNRGARVAWQGNIFAGLRDSFTEFQNHPLVKENLARMASDPEFAADMWEKLDFRDEDTEEDTGDENTSVNKNIVKDIETTASKLRGYAKSMQARLVAVSKFGMSFDQMSGTFQPHVSQGRDLSGMTNAEIAQALHAEYEKALKTIDVDGIWLEPDPLQDVPRPAPEVPVEATQQGPTAATVAPPASPVVPAPPRAPVKPKVVAKPKQTTTVAVEPAETGPGKNPVPPRTFVGAQLHPSGVRILFAKDILRPNFRNALSVLSKVEQSVFRTVLNSKFLEHTQVVAGTREQITEYMREKKLSSLQAITESRPDQVIKGFYSAQENTAYIISPAATIETYVHELIHAATYQLIQAHYDGKLKVGFEKDAIIRLEGLMKQFLHEGSEGVVPGSPADQAIQSAYAEISLHRELHEQDETPFQKAAQLNEFIAWTLANRSIAETLATRGVADKFVKLVRATWDQIKKVIWGGQRAPDGYGQGTDVLSQVRFNTAVLTQSTLTLEKQISNVLLSHATLSETTDTGEPTRLERTLKAFGTLVARHLNQNYSKAWLDDLPKNNSLTRPLEIATVMATEAEKHFNLSGPLERETFHMMVLALATEARINPASLTEAAKIYDQFLKTNNTNSFLKDPNTPEGTTENKLTKSREAFEFLSGQGRLDDPFQRSTVLPVFIALGVASEEFRNHLAKQQMPVDAKQQVVGINTAMEALGTAGLNHLDGFLSGKDHPENMQAAIDQLTHHVTKQVLTAQSTVDNVMEKVHHTSHGINGKMVELIKAVGDSAHRKGDELTQSGSKLDLALGSFLKTVSFITSEKSAAAVSEGWLDQMDKMTRMPGWVRDFMGSDGLLGRVVSQSKIYDMYKKVRATVAQNRQGFREHVPFVIQSKFSELGRTGYEAVQHMMYHTAGRSDLASLLDGRSIQDVLKLAGDTNLRAHEIMKYEAQLKALQPKHTEQYLAKIDQLVEYMLGGPHGTNLLRNAHSISELLGEQKDRNSFMAPGKDLVAAIDQLVTLRYLDEMGEGEQKTFSQLVKDEPAGMEFILSYLKGNREAEMKKATDGMALYNHHKGQLPSESNNGHLTVVPDSDHTKMVLLGYTRTGAYIGSSIDDTLGESHSYYFSPEGGARTQFNQGLIQNVQGTAFGVHTLTGLSSAPNAGYITNPETVEKLAAQFAQEQYAGEDTKGLYGRENLSPVYDMDKKVVAFERTLDPKQLDRIAQDQHLGKMIGHWRGRQVEEVQSQKINEEVLNHLSSMWEKDKSVAGANKRYENLYQSKSPVIQDAMKLLPRDVREGLEERFGAGNFPVRRNLVNQIIGYRSASIGDMWTGNTNTSQAFQDVVKKSLITILGVGAYRKLLWAERNWQAVTSTMRTNIVARSMTVAAANTISGLYQLKASGVPMITIGRELPKKLAEIEYYTRANAKKVNLEAELHARTDSTEVAAVQGRIRVLEDSLKRLSIWPLIEAGEFSAIADVGQTAENFGKDDGTVVEQLEAAVDKLPPGLRDAARLGYIARDTALFQGLQKSIQYSDFVMKSIYYDHMLKHEAEFLEEAPGYEETLNDPDTKKRFPTLEDAQKYAREETAKGRITEAFSNYDLPTGRGRQYLESMGLAWFLNYKIRAVKVGLSMMRNNPLDVLLFAGMPHPMAGGIPVVDNLFSRFFQGSIGHAFGPGMLAQPIAWNSWYNLFGS